MLSWEDWRPVVLDTGLVKPDRQVAPIDPRTIVVRPVRDLVAGFLLRRAYINLRSRSHLTTFYPEKPVKSDWMTLYYANAVSNYKF